MKPYKAYIFDFDGVIKESVRVKSKAFVQLYEAEGIAFQKRVEEHHLTNGGISRYVKFKVWNEWLGRSTSTETIETLAQKFSQLVVDNVIAAPYVSGAQDSIHSAKKNALSFIATGTPDNEIDEIMDRLDLTSSFNEVHGSSRKKPEIVKDILDRYNLDPSEVLFIGDAQTDYQAALKHKLDFYLRETDYNSAWFTGKPCVAYKNTDLEFLNKIINK
jgi:phosphoglycolate phosphatase-like HAD superfamily hydrolase